MSRIGAVVRLYARSAYPDIALRTGEVLRLTHPRPGP